MRLLNRGGDEHHMKLTIHHLYADMMNLYGDRGNVISIKKRCEWRAIPVEVVDVGLGEAIRPTDRKSTRLNSSHANISYAVFCLKKNKDNYTPYNSSNPLCEMLTSDL